MRWEFSPVGVLSLLGSHHPNTYPDDNLADWKIHCSAAQDRYAYLLVVQYKNPGRIGDLYSNRSISGTTIHMFDAKHDITGWIKFITHDFDQCRMEIIETLDGLMVRDEQPIKELVEYGKRVPGFEYVQEYPINNDPFNWEAQYSYKIGPQGFKGLIA